MAPKRKNYTNLPDEQEASSSTAIPQMTQPDDASTPYYRRSGSRQPVSELPSRVDEEIEAVWVETEANTMQTFEFEDNENSRRSAMSIAADFMKDGLKKKLYLLLEDPSSSPAAFVVNVFVSFMIVLSTVVSTVETIPAFHYAGTSLCHSHASRFNFETTIVFLFTVEYLLRFYAHSDSREQLFKFVIGSLTAPLSIIDVVAIAPYYVELVLKRDTLSIEVMIIAMKKSSDALYALFLFFMLTIIVFSSLLYFVERGVWDEEKEMFVTPSGGPSKFDSIPASFWYVIVTLTTTGYGDMVPETFIGKLISFPIMMCGILLIALPSIIVGRHFTVVWDYTKRHRPNQRLPNAEDNQEQDPLGPVGRYSISDLSRMDAFRTITPDPLDANRDYAMLNNDNQNRELGDQVQALMEVQKSNQLMIKKILKLLENQNIANDEDLNLKND
ncbi:voltage-gated potassium channel [Basidiobolus meristosporus CBS 931.73]|uniref:Voltage-gated potassium channel n=1 Tax=Basidiobolus meristosporus CBS 931.73 TaxID=1314790 RepID=A0A1Y1XWL4_9FUNG|nr:voltage-gated potassium channel [Basidiobolus meristosporus CBS 931.73]|eukprot:ORX90113.1 voltage-gated potassium channel [Basidiobolus meristosporus CBS 931.73]